MKRRSFFGGLAGLLLSPLGVKAKAPGPAEGDPTCPSSLTKKPDEQVIQEVRRRCLAMRQAVLDHLEEDLWGRPPKGDGPSLMGIKHFIMKK
jgi:hypothetical protein